MRILIYGLNFAPELTGIGKYSGEMAAWLVEQGHEVHVITTAPYYPAWQVQEGYQSWRYRIEKHRGLTIYRCPLWVPRNPRTSTRLLHLISFALSSLAVLFWHMLWRPTVILVVIPTILSAPAGWMIARLSGAVACLHVQDFEVDIAQGLGQINIGLIAKLTGRMERFWLRRFDRVSTISVRMVERLAAKGVDGKRRILFPNWVDTDAIQPLTSKRTDSGYTMQLMLPDEAIVALYSGNMGEKQGLEIVIDAARALKGNANIVFVLAGAGAARSRMEVRAKGLSNIKWLPLQPVEKLNELLNLADIHLLPQRADAADLVMPSKLTGMLASGRPVVATATPGTQLAQIVAKCGLVVEPGSVDQFADAICELARDEELRGTLGRTARQYAVTNLARDAVLNEFQQSLNAAVDEKRGKHHAL